MTIAPRSEGGKGATRQSHGSSSPNALGCEKRRMHLATLRRSFHRKPALSERNLAKSGEIAIAHRAESRPKFRFSTKAKICPNFRFSTFFEGRGIDGVFPQRSDLVFYWVSRQNRLIGTFKNVENRKLGQKMGSTTQERTENGRDARPLGASGRRHRREADRRRQGRDYGVPVGAG